MESPWPPRTSASTSRTETPSSMAMKARKRAESSTPAIPTTRSGGKPVRSQVSHVITSRGLVTQMTTASGAWAATESAIPPTIRALVARRSSRLIPGLRATPAVITTRSEPAISAALFVPQTLAS